MRRGQSRRALCLKICCRKNRRHSENIKSITSEQDKSVVEIRRFFVYQKPLAGRVVQKSLSEEEEIKTPFAIMKMRSANCTQRSKRRTFRMSLNDINSLSHTKWNCKYHIVFVPKYRRKVFYGEKRREIGEILRTLCNWEKIKIIEAEECPEHVHMLVETPPKVAVSSFMGYLKGKTSPCVSGRGLICSYNITKKLYKHRELEYDKMPLNCQGKGGPSI